MIGQNVERTFFRLPPNLRIDELTGFLFEGDNLLCNYIPMVVKCWTEESEDGSIEDYVSFYLKIGGVICDREYFEPFSALKALSFSGNAKCKDFSSHRRIMKSFDLIIRSSIDGMFMHKVTAYHRLGFTTYHGEPAYLAGNRLLSQMGFIDSADFVIDEGLQGLNLEVDFSLSAKQAFVRLMRQMLLHSLAAPILIAFTFLSLVHSRLIACGIVPGCSLYLSGKSGTVKTTLAYLLANIYNRQSTGEPCSIDLSSSEASILHGLNFYRDCVFIVDDLHEEESRTSGKHLQDKLGRILRLSGNHRAAEKMVGNHLSSIPPKAMILSTGEFPLSVESTVARSILVPMDSGIDFGLASQTQQQPCILPTCVYHFLCWYLKNAVEIEKNLPERYREYRKQLASAVSNPHLATNGAALLLGMHLLLSYGESIGSKNRHEMMECFIKKVMNLIEINNEMIIKLSSNTDKPDLVEDIISLYRAKEFQLSFPGQFRPGLDDGIIKNDTVCLMPGCLLDKLASRHPDQNITKRQIGRQLREAGLLLMDVSERTTEKKTEQGFYMYHLDRFKLTNF